MDKHDTKALRIVFSPDSGRTPLSLFYHALLHASVNVHVRVKEKAYGLLINGSREAVDRIASTMRNMEPDAVFAMESAPPIKGHRAFRNFLQLSADLRTLPLISQALSHSYHSGNGRRKAVPRLVRCRYTTLPIDALLIDLDNGEVEVRCPEMVIHGCPVCCRPCPYGELILW